LKLFLQRDRKKKRRKVGGGVSTPAGVHREKKGKETSDTAPPTFFVPPLTRTIGGRKGEV